MANNKAIVLFGIFFDITKGIDEIRSNGFRILDFHLRWLASYKLKASIGPSLNKTETYEQTENEK